MLVDDELIYAYYDQAIPEGIHTGAAFERWYRDEVKKGGQPEDKLRLLYLSRDDLMRHEAAGVTTELFPKRATMAGVEMALTYHFGPGTPRDGVTLAVPLYALNQVDARRCEWLVPGMLKEKVQLLLKSLPQKLRRHCVPLPEYAAGFVERMGRERFGAGGAVEALIADVRGETQIAMKTADFKLETLPAHLFMNFKVIDEHGRQLAMGRNLAQLRQELGAQAQQQFQKIAAASTIAAGGDADGGEPIGRPATAATTGAAGRHAKAGKGAAPQTAAPAEAGATALYENLTTWNFGKLPELLEIRRRGQTLYGYPALVDRGTHCDVEVFDSPEEAARIHRAGLRRLFALQLKEPIKFLEKNLPGLREMAMQYMSLGTQDELRDQLIDTALDRACLQDPLPDDDASFHARRDEGRSRLNLLAQEIARLVGQILPNTRGREEARAGEAVRAGACGPAAAARRAGRQALRDRYAVRATGALPALPEGHRAADRQAEGRPGARREAVGRPVAARPAVPARGVAARRRRRCAARGIPLAARGTADFAVRAGTAHTDACLCQASAQGMGVDAALAQQRFPAPVAGPGRPRAPAAPADRPPRRASKWRNAGFVQPAGPVERFTMTVVPRRESSCALSFPRPHARAGRRRAGARRTRE